MQTVLGFDVFTTALLTLPGAIALTATCVGTARIEEWIGRKTALVATHLLISLGVFILLFTSVKADVPAFIASTAIAGIGYGLSFSLVAEVAVSAVPAERAGAAGSIAALSLRLLGPGVAGTLNQTLDRAGIVPEAVLQAKEAFPSGLHIAVGVGGLLTLIVGVAAWLWLPE